MPLSGVRRDRLGDALTWLAGGALAANLVLILGLVALIAANGLGHFWQDALVELELDDGSVVLGEVWDREPLPAARGEGERLRLRTANRDLGGFDFRWIDQARVQQASEPRDAILLERVEWGDFFGYPEGLRLPGHTLTDLEALWELLPGLVEEKAEERAALRRFESRQIGEVNRELEALRLERRVLARAGRADSARVRQIDVEMRAAQARYEALVGELEQMRRTLGSEVLALRTAGGASVEVPLARVVRAVRPNALGTGGRLALYADRVGEFVAGEPRESNTEGGIFPAIFGTVMMVFLMSVVVAPFGVLAAVYMHEYAREGTLLRVIRIAVNNLAGVPSIVFGVFGLGFFVYLVGGSLDQLFYPERLPTPTYGTGGILWASLTLALLTVPVVIVATEEGLSAVPLAMREGSMALGATRWETIRRVVLPASVPGILTGVILAVGRAAGEVAPLMIVGMVKLAPSLPIDGYFPYVHLERKFMHLGFHIYDLAFQSPDVEAAKPLVFATALLLILVVLAANLAAIGLRNRLRRRHATSSV